MLTALCLLAGFAALAGMGSVVGVLLLGLGLGGASAAAGFGILSMLAGLGAAILAWGRKPAIVLE